MASILIIDDEPQIRLMLSMKLESHGYDVKEADDGRSGLKLFRENPTDLIITDLIMPEKEGIETISEVKSEFPDVKIIAISGGGRFGPDGYLDIAKGIGAERTFSKPIELKELLKAVEELIGR
ncbi:MAG: response regulator [Desulfobacterales bacterium]|nr:response regulator [Desulfobacterales bacterium]